MSEEDWDCEVSTEKKSRSSPPREYHSKSYTNSRRDRDYDNCGGGHRYDNSDGGHRSGSGNDNWRANNRNSTNPPRSSGQFSETLEINRDRIGLVIGKGGSNIKDVQSRFSVNVNVDKNSNYSGTNSVIVSGDSQTNVDDALNHLRDQVENAQQRGNDKRRDDRSDRYQNSDRRDDRSDKHQISGGYRSYENDRHSRDEKKSERDGGGYSDYKSKSNDYGKSKSNDYGYSKSNDYDNSDSYADPVPEYKPIDWESLNKMADEERKARWAKCPELIKDFYEEHPKVAALTNEQVAKIREENNNITVERLVFKENETSSRPIPNPVWKFEQCFSKYPDLMEEIRKQGFERPSPIQSQAWPVLLRGEDLIGIAQTGTGKTLAFLLPAMIHTEFQPVPRNKRGGPNVLVLAPTRELALQIEKEVGKYSFRGMKAVCVYGGGDRREQINIVTQGVEIVIATPGRLNDLVQANVINISSVTYLVLDEADRMLDMGFEPQIRKVLIDIRPDRQTIMTSATWPPGVRRLAQSYMNNPIQVCVGTLDLAAVHTVRQIIDILSEEEKYERILQFINEMRPSDKAIVFCGRKARADDLSSDLTLKGILCQCIHGSRDQSDREQAITDISTGDVKILIATDVASRGLDIEDITYVVNYDFPRNIEEYVHRVGRTGRAGRKGTSISFVTREDWGSAKELIEILEEANQEVPEEIREMAKRFQAMKERRANESAAFGGGFGGGGGGRKFGGGGGGGFGRGGGGGRRPRF